MYACMHIIIDAHYMQVLGCICTIQYCTVYRNLAIYNRHMQYMEPEKFKGPSYLIGLRYIWYIHFHVLYNNNNIKITYNIILLHACYIHTCMHA